MVRNGLKVEAFDIGKRGSSSDVVFDALRDAIIRGQLAEGEILRQDTIAQMFNVSRIPVREALQRLEAQGHRSVGNAEAALLHRAVGRHDRRAAADREDGSGAGAGPHQYRQEDPAGRTGAVRCGQ